MSRKTARQQAFYARQKRARRVRRELRAMGTFSGAHRRAEPRWIDATCITDTYKREVFVGYR